MFNLDFLGNSQFWNVAQLGTGLLTGFGQMQQSSAIEQMGDRNAQILEQQAKAERESQELTAYQKRRLIKSRIGSQTAAVAKSGIKQSGSALDVMADSLSNAYLDLAIDKYNSEVTARGYENQAAMTRYEGQQEASRAKAKAGGSFLASGLNFLKSQREIGG
jgi:hypothetical protein